MSAVIAVVGAGALGGRHLQALGRLRGDHRIYAADPSPSSPDLARRRFAEGGGDGDALRCVEGVDGLPSELDVVVVATTADIRAAVVEDLVGHHRVRFLVLEKVLFQRLAEYATIGRLLRDHAVPAWVNLARRQFDGYRPLVEALAPASWIDYRVTGSSWGLGCNGIHFLDQMAQLAGDGAPAVDASGLDPGSVPARRQGFRDFTGRLSGRCGRATFALTSMATGAAPLQITIESDAARFVIREDGGGSAIDMLAATPESAWEYSPRRAELPPQSRLTDLVVSDLLADGSCRLAPFDEAAALHVPFLAALLDHVHRWDDAGADACPIT